MSLAYLLDTNVLSEAVRVRPNPKVMQQLKRRQASLATASLVLHELLYGVSRLPDSERRRGLLRYVHEVVGATVPILSYDERAARWHAAERARLEREGRRPPFVDGQIAAIARVNDLILVTNNPQDYAGFEGLAVENWHA